MQIDLRFTLTVDDLYDFRKAYSGISKQMPKADRPLKFSRSFFGWVILLVLAILLFAIFHRDPPHPAPAARHTPPSDPVMEYLFMVLPYIFIGSFLWFFFIRPRFFGKSALKKALEKDPRASQPQQWLLTDQSATQHAVTCDTTFQWHHFTYFAETPSSFLLFVNDNTAHLLPKRAFPSDAVAAEFRAFAQAHIGHIPDAFPIQPAPAPPPTTAP